MFANIETAIINPAISAAAAGVADAEAQLAERQRVAAQAGEAHEAICARIADIDQKKGAIGARRLDGDWRSTDAGEIGLLELDRSGLAQMEQEAAAMLTEHAADLAAADQRLAEARAALAQAEAMAEIDLLKRHANELGLVMLETIKRMAAAGRRVGSHTFSWKPSEDLWDAIRDARIAGRPR